MPEPTAVADLLEIMGDRTVSLRQRLNAAVSASRVERLQLPGEAPPASIVFLRWIINFKGAGGVQLDPTFRREAAAATAYFERRSAKAALTYDIADLDTKRRQWRDLINGSLRRLMQRGWGSAEALIGPDDPFEMPVEDPERCQAALLQERGSTRTRRRLRAVDDPGTLPAIASEAERAALIRAIAKAAHRRLAEVSAAPLSRAG